METVLITGVGGFIGSTMLKKYVSSPDNKVIGIYTSSLPVLYGVNEPLILSYNKEIHECDDSAKLYDFDIRDKQRVMKVISTHQPDIIYHLAAQSLPMASIAEPCITMDVNVIGTINIFESIRLVKRIHKNYDPVVVVACSSAEYGESFDTSLNEGALGIPECAALKPLHPYGISKVAQDMLARYYYTQWGIKTIRARIFNTTGPGKFNDVCSDLISRAIKIKYSKVPYKLSVGNLGSRRAILDVKDTISALDELAHKGTYGEAYNISAHSAVSVQEIINKIEHIANTKFDVEIDPAYVRSNDEPIIIGDTSKIEKDVGWVPTISLQKTLEDMYKYWDERAYN